MIFGEIVFRLQAVNESYLPRIHGRFMHAAFFAALRDMSGEVAGYVHDEMNIKPFTVSELSVQGESAANSAKEILLKPGNEFIWRVTAFSETILTMLNNLPEGYVFKMGRSRLKLMAKEGVLVEEEDFIARCLETAAMNTISFEFLSPVSFRYFKDDYPLPLPEYIWSSLADKWFQLGMDMVLDKAEIKLIASKIIPIKWLGRTEMVCFDKVRRINGFVGSFEFSLRNLTAEEKQLIFILAQFSYFAGVGRLTAQGLGQTEVSWK